MKNVREFVASNQEFILEIKENAVYKTILEDSFGGVMYNVSNEWKYDLESLNSIFNKYGLDNIKRFDIDWIMQWAFEFVDLI